MTSFAGSALVLGVVLGAFISRPAHGTSAEPGGVNTPLVAAGIPSEGPFFAVPTTPDRIGRIIAVVTINGRGPFHFMLDTGANRTVLAASLVSQLGLQLNKDEQVAVTGVSGSVLAATVHVDSLDADTLHLRDMSVPVLAGPVLADIDGILGVDGFEGKTMTADFIRDRITIRTSMGGVPLGDMVVPGYRGPQGLLMVEAIVGGVRTRAIIDTGGTRTLGNEALLHALRHTVGADVGSVPTRVVDATELVREGTLEQAPTLQFGTAKITNLYITFGEFNVFKSWDLERQPALLVGMDVLGTFAEISVDFRRREFGVLPRPAQVVALH